MMTRTREQDATVYPSLYLLPPWHVLLVALQLNSSQLTLLGPSVSSKLYDINLVVH
jgi:hypothetical protein